MRATAQDTTVVTETTVVNAEDYAVDTTETTTEYTMDTFRIEDRVMSNEAWNELKSNKAFSYKDEKEAEEKIEPKKDEQESGLYKALVSFYTFLFSGLGQVLFWLLVFGIIAYILYRIFKGDISFIWARKEKKDKNKEQAVETLSHEDLVNADWEAKLAAALQAGNMRLATRYAFVHMLQLLHQQQYISYRIDATNYEYYLALDKEELKPLFRQLLLRYEYAWFGKFQVSNEDWTETMRIYKEIKNKL